MKNVDVYCIYDSKAECYLPPWFAPNIGVAMRTVDQALRNPQSGFTQYPADYTLFKIGEFDDRKGVLIPLEAHQNFGNLLQFVPQQTPNADDRQLEFVNSN